MKRKKSLYLFLILFILLVSKDYIMGLFYHEKDLNFTNEYTKKLEKEINSINLIKNNNYKSKYIYAKVLYQNPYKPGYVMVLTDGDEIKYNDIVLSDKGVIGSVNKVYKNEAEIKLMTSKDSLMQVKVGDCYGLLQGGDKLTLKGVSNYCQVNVGDKVYTSNLGYVDEEIEVGIVKDIIKDANLISNNYEISLSSNMNDLHYLVIITGEK